MPLVLALLAALVVSGCQVATAAGAVAVDRFDRYLTDRAADRDACEAGAAELRARRSAVLMACAEDEACEQRQMERKLALMTMAREIQEECFQYIGPIVPGLWD